MFGSYFGGLVPPTVPLGLFYTLQQVCYSGSVLNNCIWIRSCDLFLFELILKSIRGFQTSSNFRLERFSDYMDDYFQLIL